MNVRVLAGTGSTLLLAAALAGAASAGPGPVTRTGAVGAAPIASPSTASRSGTRPLSAGVLYDNVGSGSTLYYAGQGGAEALDDLHLISGGSLDQVLIECNDPISETYTATVRIYDNPGGLDLGAIPLAGPYTLTGIAGGGRQTVTIALPDAPVVGKDLWVGVQFSTATAGLVINSVPSVGSSHDLYLEGGNLFSFGGNPLANFAIELVDLPSHTLGVTATGMGSVTKSPDQSTYLDGSGVQLTATADAHWHFVGWSGDASGNTNPLPLTMDADKSITATFAIDTQTLSVGTVGNGTVQKSPDQPSYDYGTPVMLTAVPATGWHLAAWSGDASGAANPLTVTTNADLSITATFAIDADLLSISIVGHGTVLKTPDQASYDYGTPVSVTASPAIGWHFVGWSGDAAGNTNPLPLTMDGSKSLTATFAIDTHTLSVSTAGNGTVSKAPDQPSYDYGTPVTLTATPAIGWHLVAWSGDASGATNPLPVTLNADLALTATFAINTYTLTLSAIGNGTVAADPVQASYDHGTPVSVTATAALGSHFVGWSGGATGALDPLPLTMTANTSLTATFVVDSYVFRSADFEAGLSGWEGYGGGTLSRTSPGHGGSSFAALLTATSPGTEFGLNDTPAWVTNSGSAGTHYRVSAWVRSNANTGAARIRVREYSNGDNQQTVYSPTLTLSGTWQRLVLDLVTIKSNSLWDIQVLDKPVASLESFLTDDVTIEVIGSPTASVSDPGATEFARPVVYPDPAFGSATLALSLRAPGSLRVEVWDVAGRSVRVLADEKSAAAGTHRFALGRQGGGKLESGVYFYRAEFAGAVHHGRFVILD